MRNIFIKPASPLRKFFPLIQKLRGWAFKFYERTSVRLVISGGKVQFMDAELKSLENVGQTLVPRKKISREVFFLAAENVGEIFPA